MRLWVRLATFCLSLALLAGVLMHDVAGARMSIDMAATDATDAVEQQDDPCPACAQQEGEQAACDFDCTAQLLSTETAPMARPQAVALIGLDWPADAALRTRDPGFDPAPPRATILS